MLHIQSMFRMKCWLILAKQQLYAHDLIRAFLRQEVCCAKDASQYGQLLINSNVLLWLDVVCKGYKMEHTIFLTC